MLDDLKHLAVLEVIRKGTPIESGPRGRYIGPFRMNIGDSVKGFKRSDDDDMDASSDRNDLIELQTKLKLVNIWLFLVLLRFITPQSHYELKHFLTCREAKLPQHAHKIVIKDLQRLKRMGPHSPEHGVIRSWLELIVDLPWARASQETLDIHKARKVL